MGLAIAKAIVEAHGGSIEVFRQAEKGSVHLQFADIEARNTVIENFLTPIGANWSQAEAGNVIIRRGLGI
jgi:signal transduction histidine kinase